MENILLAYPFPFIPHFCISLKDHKKSVSKVFESVSQLNYLQIYTSICLSKLQHGHTYFYTFLAVHNSSLLLTKILIHKTCT